MQQVNVSRRFTDGVYRDGLVRHRIDVATRNAVVDTSTSGQICITPVQGRGAGERRRAEPVMSRRRSECGANKVRVSGSTGGLNQPTTDDAGRESLLLQSVRHERIQDGDQR